MTEVLPFRTISLIQAKVDVTASLFIEIHRPHLTSIKKVLQKVHHFSLYGAMFVNYVLYGTFCDP